MFIGKQLTYGCIPWLKKIVACLSSLLPHQTIRPYKLNKKVTIIERQNTGNAEFER